MRVREAPLSARAQFIVPAEDGELFNTAVYQFVETQLTGDPCGVLAIETEPLDGAERKTVTLWNEQALAALASYWRLAVPARAPSRRPMPKAGGQGVGAE